MRTKGGEGVNPRRGGDSRPFASALVRVSRLSLSTCAVSTDAVIPHGTVGVGCTRTGVVLGGAQLLTVMNVRMVACLSVAILTTSPLVGISVMARWAVENRWRVGI